MGGFIDVDVVDCDVVVSAFDVDVVDCDAVVSAFDIDVVDDCDVVVSGFDVVTGIMVSCVTQTSPKRSAFTSLIHASRKSSRKRSLSWAYSSTMARKRSSFLNKRSENSIVSVP